MSCSRFFSRFSSLFFKNQKNAHSSLARGRTQRGTPLLLYAYFGCRDNGAHNQMFTTQQQESAVYDAVKDGEVFLFLSQVR